jgi:hypothetical protein
MLKRLNIYHLEDPPTDAQLEERIIDEYARTERAYIDARGSLSPGQCVDIRYEDLRADPIGQMRHVYASLDLEWTDRFESRIVHYLHSISGYEPATRTSESAQTRTHLQFIDDAFNHDLPVVPALTLPDDSYRTVELAGSRWWSTALWLFALAVILGLAWHGIVRMSLNRYDTLVWLVGALLGAVGLRRMRQGSAKLGWACAILTLVVAMAVAVPNTRYAFYMRHDPERAHVSWDDLWNTTKREWSAGITLFWVGMGMVTAYRLGSRGAIRPPGTLPN